MTLYLHQWTDHPDRNSIRKLALNDTMDRMDSGGTVSGSSARLLLPLASYVPSALQVSASSWQHYNRGGGTPKGLDQDRDRTG